MIKESKPNRYNPKICFNVSGSIKKVQKPQTKILKNKNRTLFTVKKQIIIN